MRLNTSNQAARGTRRTLVQDCLHCHPRVHPEYFPVYAPALNPAEHLWTRTDEALANSAPQNVRDLTHRLQASMCKLKASPSLLWSCMYASNLPWPH